MPSTICKQVAKISGDKQMITTQCEAASVEGSTGLRGSRALKIFRSFVTKCKLGQEKKKMGGWTDLDRQRVFDNSPMEN